MIEVLLLLGQIVSSEVHVHPPELATCWLERRFVLADGRRGAVWLGVEPREDGSCPASEVCTPEEDGSCPTLDVCTLMDLTHDGVINSLDFRELTACWGRSVER